MFPPGRSAAEPAGEEEQQHGSPLPRVSEVEEADNEMMRTPSVELRTWRRSRRVAPTPTPVPLRRSERLAAQKAKAKVPMMLSSASNLVTGSNLFCEIDVSEVRTLTCCSIFICDMKLIMHGLSVSLQTGAGDDLVSTYKKQILDLSNELHKKGSDLAALGMDYACAAIMLLLPS